MARRCSLPAAPSCCAWQEQARLQRDNLKRRAEARNPVKGHHHSNLSRDACIITVHGGTVVSPGPTNVVVHRLELGSGAAVFAVCGTKRASGHGSGACMHTQGGPTSSKNRLAVWQQLHPAFTPQVNGPIYRFWEVRPSSQKRSSVASNCRTYSELGAAAVRHTLMQMSFGCEAGSCCTCMSVFGLAALQRPKGSESR